MPLKIQRSADEAWPRATMALVTLESICVLVLESLVLREHIIHIHQPPAGNALSTPNIIYPILYMLAIASVLSLCADAMYHRNQIQVVAFTMFNFLCFTYGIIQTIYDWQADGTGGPLKAYNVAITVTIGVCTLFLIYAVCKLAKVFGWEMYRFLGADPNMRRMHKGYEILITLLKFDVFFFVAYAVQMFTLVDTTDKTIVATLSNGRTLARHQLLIGLAIPASIILLALAFFGVMKENRIISVFVMICLMAVEPYFIYQLIYLQLPENSSRFINSVKYLTFFIAVTMVLVLATLVFMVYCFRNFGKGLLISEKSRIAKINKPFEIDEDPIEAVPTVLIDSKQEEGVSQQLMAYPALKKIQQDYRIKPSSHDRNSSNERYSSGSYGNNSKMEID
ncbi:hypothetical protein BX616_006482 [Lobosporangium transversale]|uniref:Uncharacterized protein n=1 Tax=Lobosporangium transversale TaxID=64571 RepID=A0A1Y2GV64_9FUNG|nr:hypothetical protein BCR41DRAFT_351016 [Lobosporangium transversale]KAF9915294.1 hypothetical protein BX616_006482 [Lobosporangium transversale]ORZ19939.1 hypothetical protein BCR41DRAFT_351016 [Lobosporangium transversale]|eukprot:XP_021882479.1 hypothetical protein BCR41DRAFT_351016 [Lobosporangium transversale]